MKKHIIFLMLASFLALGAFAQANDGFTFDGKVLTGFLWSKDETLTSEDTYKTETKVRLRNLDDDAGSGQGRIRMNFSYVNGDAGIKGRLQWDDWQNTQKAPEWPYLFGYINTIEDQLTVSMGKLGSSPWGTGGPEKYKELEAMSAGGVRVEFKPNFLSGLNVGVVLNWYDGSLDQGAGREVSLLDILRESVIGISYVNDYFLARFAYRLDSSIDKRPGSGIIFGENEGNDFIYRLEEHVIERSLPGFRLWALGVYEGIGIGVKDSCKRYENWLFVEYAPEWFKAQLRLGYDVISTRSILHIKPTYYHYFFDKKIEVGAFFYIANDFGEDRLNKDAPYTEIQFEPKLQFNFIGAYVAFAYNFKQIYKQPNPAVPYPIERFQTMNLRFGMTF